MAVSVESNGSYRADFMVGNAAANQRTKQGAAKQDDGFAKLLDSRSGEQTKPTGSVNSSGSVNARSSYKAPEVKPELERVCEVPEKEALVVEPSEEMNIVRAEETVAHVGADIPEDTMELARKIVNGDIDIKDVPIDRITLELLKAIMMVKKFEDPQKDDEDDEDDQESDVFNPALQFAAQDNAAMTMEDQILLEISLILAADSEETPLAGVEGISDAMSEETIPMAGEIFEYTQTVDNSQAAAELSTEVSEEAEVQLANGANAKKAGETTEAAKTNETEGNVVVRKIAQPEEKTDLSQQQSGEQNASYNQQSSVSKEISEELEMLRNAKLGKAKSVVEGSEAKAQPTGESGKAGETAPVHTANPLTADAPIMLAGKGGAMIQVRPSEVMAQVTKIVEQAISENREQTEYSMVLNPEELGKITVKLIKAADGAVSVTIVAENASTQRMLEQNGELMQSNLRANGVQLQSWQTVNEAHQETMQREYEGSSKNPYYREENDKTDDEQSEGESFADIIAAM